MKKYFALLLLATVFTFAATAQQQTGNKASINLSAESYIPTGRIANSYSVGLGASLKLEVPVAQSLNFALKAGYSALFYTDNVKQGLRYLNDNASADGFVPLQGGLKYYLLPQFYAEGLVGGVISTNSGTGTYFNYSPGIGIIFPVQFGNAIDVGVRYEGWHKDNFTLSFIGLHAGFKFGL